MTTPYQPPQGDAAKPQWRLLDDWFSNYPGRALLQAENTGLSELLPNLFGFHIVQMGTIGMGGLLESSRISHRVVFDIDSKEGAEGALGLPVCSSAAFPLDAQCVDVMVLPHVLEFVSDPHDVLRETERVLIGEGHAVIIGFNPLSSWGLWRLSLGWQDRLPWSGRFYSVYRVKDWLRLLGFDIVQVTHVYFRSPLRRPSQSQRAAIMDKLGRHLWSWGGGAYIVVAKKRLSSLIPIKEHWKLRRRLIVSGITQPSTRQHGG